MLAATSLVAGACTRADEAVETGASETTAADGSGGGETAAAGDFGDLKGVCGPGDASGATTQGVTDDAIQVGTISDSGFAGRPGLNQELFDASHVFVDWCNAAGGINGRELKVVERDAKLTEYKQRITEACAEDFMLVGGGGVFDDTGQAERIGCMLPEIPAFQVSPQSRASELIVNPIPAGLDEVQAGTLRYLGESFPDSTEHVGFLTGTIPSTVFIDAQLQDAAEELGWTKVYEAQYNPSGEASWTPFAQALKSDGVKGLVYSGEPENLAALQQALADIDYQLDWTLGGSNAVDQGFIDVGGEAVNGVYLPSLIVPAFMADENPATQQYLDLFEEYLPDGKSMAGLGYNSFSAWLLFATAVGECGSDVTRTCVFEAAQNITEWTGGGLHGETNPGENKQSRCNIVVAATPDGFVEPDDFEPTDGLFNCSEENVIALDGDYGTGVTLESQGKTMADLE
ncbi:MAG: ABC transporter substrate-binding protein [Microthrixaceae bacterium]|nr:ABC transporter substrate-binding protein [Microthrixaceae bacterium]